MILINRIDATSASLANRIGGRWIISLKVFASLFVCSCLMLVAHLVQSPERNILVILKFWLGGILAASAISFLAHLTVFKNRATVPLPIWVVGIFQILTNGTNSFFYESGRNAANLYTPAPFITRVVTFTVLSILVSITATLIFDFFSHWHKTRDSLIEARIQTILLEKSRIDFYRQTQLQMTNGVKSELQNANPGLLTQINLSAGDSLLPYASKIANTVADFSVDVLRPLSHALWHMASKTIPRVTLRQIFKTILTRQPINTVALVIFFLITVSTDTLVTIGLGKGATFLLVSAAIIVSVGSIINRLMRKFYQYHAGLFVGTFIIFQILTLVSNIVQPKIGMPSVAPTFFFTQVVTSAILLLVTSALGAWKSANTATTEQLANEIKEDQLVAIALSRKTSEHARDLAGTLHGAVQTRLTACSLMIDRAIQENDNLALNLALLEAVSVLQTPILQDEKVQTLSEEIERKVALWQGLCQIDVQIDVQIDESVHESIGLQARDIGRVVEEAISNAIRHGAATEMKLVVSSGLQNSILIQLDDNGLQPSNKFAGVGSAIFTQTTHNNWSLLRTEFGNRLVATVPIK